MGDWEHAEQADIDAHMMSELLSEQYCEGFCKESGGKGTFDDCTGCFIHPLEQRIAELETRLTDGGVYVEASDYHKAKQRIAELELDNRRLKQKHDHIFAESRRQRKASSKSIAVLEAAIKELDRYLQETPVHVDFQVMARIKAATDLLGASDD